MPKHFRCLEQFGKIKMFSSISKNSNLYLVLCISSIIHILYFFAFFDFLLKTQIFKFLFCNMYKMHNSYFVIFGNVVNCVILGFFGFLYSYIYYTCGSPFLPSLTGSRLIDRTSFFGSL